MFLIFKVWSIFISYNCKRGMQYLQYSVRLDHVIRDLTIYIYIIKWLWLICFFDNACLECVCAQPSRSFGVILIISLKGALPLLKPVQFECQALKNYVSDATWWHTCRSTWAPVWLIAPQQQAITWTNVDSSSKVFYDICLRAILQEVLMNLIHDMCSEVTLLTLLWYPSGANEFIVITEKYWIWVK